MGVGNAFETTKELLSLHHTHASALKDIRELARRYMRDSVADDRAEEKIKTASAKILPEEARVALSLKVRLHSETLSVILNACFALESYINSLGFFLLRERDIIGLVRNSTPSATEAFLEAIDRMSTLTKWQTLAKLKSNSGFDPSSPPFQDLKTLFRFRDDHVHDKVVELRADRSKERYSNKLPDPFGGSLLLSHALFACDTYWGMVLKIHELTGIPPSDFHRHYNLKPWFDGEFEGQVRQAAKDYEKVVEG